MKSFSLISLAAILSHLTPAIAISSFKCGESVIGPATIQDVINNAFATNQQSLVPGSDDKVSLKTYFDVPVMLKSNQVIVRFELGANSRREAVYLIATVNGQKIPCTPTTEKPDYNEVLARS
ncbi:CSEP0167 putative effector protein [Blumeria hordei DH14]|uniref:CSEP0167 putative effector protein n=1 Tax=Blumeria graminis f. sp. hordei (strain DH14) TaxID=546991 RepID=N1JK10_BLUG1|nr:CSEP0167 putative effector protein [Blumeria hordei DH14]